MCAETENGAHRDNNHRGQHRSNELPTLSLKRKESTDAELLTSNIGLVSPQH
jgi:hypothetical protein